MRHFCLCRFCVLVCFCRCRWKTLTCLQDRTAGPCWVATQREWHFVREEQVAGWCSWLGRWHLLHTMQQSLCPLACSAFCLVLLYLAIYVHQSLIKSCLIEAMQQKSIEKCVDSLFCSGHELLVQITHFPTAGTSHINGHWCYLNRWKHSRRTLQVVSWTAGKEAPLCTWWTHLVFNDFIIFNLYLGFLWYSTYDLSFQCNYCHWGRKCYLESTHYFELMNAAF